MEFTKYSDNYIKEVKEKSEIALLGKKTEIIL